MKAERETVDRLIAHFLADRIGNIFEGRISGVTRAGLFVKLTDTGADGLVPIRSLGTEYFNYDEARHALVGSRSGSMHKLGDVVEVRLVEALPLAGALRFELLSGGHAGPRDHRARGGRNTKRPRGPQGARHPEVHSKVHPGRKPRKASRKPGNSKAGKPKKGRS
jgi:ribonuclease R